jgi:alpha-L-arabinofuranosidase
MDRFIESVVATADHVKALKRSNRTVNISFDEWNVWYQDRFQNVEKLSGIDNWPVAPRLLEDVYSVADAVVVGNLLISLLRHADRVTAASLAQLVNVIAPIMTEPGGPAWRQTTFFPFALTARRARGVTLDVGLDSDTYRTAGYGTVNVVDAVATHDESTGQVSLFLVNRYSGGPATVTVDARALLSAGSPIRVIDAQTLSDEDVRASNTLADPHRVGPAPLTPVVDGGTITVELPPVSWTVVTVG